MPPSRPVRSAALAAALLAVAAACGDGSRGGRSRAVTPTTVTLPPLPTTATTAASRTIPTIPTTTPPTGPPARGEHAVLVAAGDIACAPGQEPTVSSCQMAATAELAASLRPDVVAPLGDLQYERGELSGFQRSYDRTWGRLKQVTRPAPGNHEYTGGKATGYFTYFGRTVGSPVEGWYSYELGSWHVVVLNSVCGPVGGCGDGSPQLRWLRADLAAHPGRCVLAYWHHPRFSSGLHGSDTAYDAFWRALFEAGADVVLNGHDHFYERFGPQTPEGVADAGRGIRQFVVGTGGRSIYPIRSRLPTSEEASSAGFGVLELLLRPAGYDWRFLPAAGNTFTDSGSGTCSG
jgi:hypothetical protein